MRVFYIAVVGAGLCATVLGMSAIIEWREQRQRSITYTLDIPQRSGPPPAVSVGDFVRFTSPVRCDYWPEGRVIRIDESDPYSILVDDGIWQLWVNAKVEECTKIDTLRPREIASYDLFEGAQYADVTPCLASKDQR